MRLNVAVVSTNINPAERYQVAEGNGAYYAYDQQLGEVLSSATTNGDYAEGTPEWCERLCVALNDQKANEKYIEEHGQEDAGDWDKEASSSK